MIARILLTVGILASHQLAFAATHQTSALLLVELDGQSVSSKGRLLPSRTRPCESESTKPSTSTKS